MSRSGYSYDMEPWDMIRYRGRVASALRGKRGQQFLRDLLAELEAMPLKRLIANDLERDGAVCALGAAMVHRGIRPDLYDPHEHEAIARDLDVAECLAREVEAVNDEGLSRTDDERWREVHAWATRKLQRHGVELDGAP